MDKGNLFLWNAAFHEFLTQVIINVVRCFAVRCGLVTEDDLCGLLHSSLLVDVINVVSAEADLARGIVFVVRIQNARIQCSGLSFFDHDEHVVHALSARRISSLTQLNRVTLTYPLRTFCQTVNQFFLNSGSISFHDLNVIGGNGQFQALGSLYIRKLFEHAREFRDVVKPRKTRLCAKALAGRIDLHGRRFLTERTRPCVEMIKPL